MMAVNADKVDRWKADVARSVDFYNRWFLDFAPEAYRNTRQKTTVDVMRSMEATDNLRNISPKMLKENPKTLSMLRTATAPPLAVDRVIGLTGVPGNLVRSMDSKGRLPPRMGKTAVLKSLKKIGHLIERLADKEVFPWLATSCGPTQDEVYRAATIVADRLCGAMANPIIRNAQEQRQLASVSDWLERRGYSFIPSGKGTTHDAMAPGTFCFHLSVPVRQDGTRNLNIPVDVAIMPKDSQQDAMPLLVEAKSAGDFTNTNKRRKEEATKWTQLRSTYGNSVTFFLFLCGYFDTGYLGYEAAEGIDWVWEHRIDDLAEFGL